MLQLETCEVTCIAAAAGTRLGREGVGRERCPAGSLCRTPIVGCRAARSARATPTPASLVAVPTSSQPPRQAGRRGGRELR
ncbi:hypothetical protein E2C01_052229 [Portunus trituberculatus]|uniref:Uncharacterized protein n=1 Tax=Portunus trituberculatus TaxID=210409 RepID=A0A5B7GLB1_PORTR|nr:hypothetical protein [Portunus trituberculatus]